MIFVLTTRLILLTTTVNRHRPNVKMLHARNPLLLLLQATYEVSNEDANSSVKPRQVKLGATRTDSYQNQELEAPTIPVGIDHLGNDVNVAKPDVSDSSITTADVQPAVMPGLRRDRFTEKTTLLDTNDELP